MVFRKLQLGLAFAALLGAACGADGSTTSTSIEMEIDTQSCFADVEGLRLNCPSTAIVVVSDQRGDTIAGDCATLPVGRLINSADVIASALALGTLPSDTPLTIGLSIHSGILSPCPEANESSAPFLFGSTDLVILEEQDSGIPLLLRCSGGVSPGVPVDPSGEECADCDNNLQACIASSGLASCDSLVQNCEFQCINGNDAERCFQTCNLLTSFCTNDGTDGSSGGVTLKCDNDQSQCIDFCQAMPPGDLCPERCFEASQLCEGYKFSQEQCESQHQGCLGECEGPGGSCLGLSF